LGDIMKTTPIYIRAIELYGIKTFANEVQLSLGKNNGAISQWTLILGDNGIGKSSILQCIAWMKPSLPYDVQDIPDDFVPSPLINDEENEVLEKLVSRSLPVGKIAFIRAQFVANQTLNQSIAISDPQFCETSIKIGLNKHFKLDVAEPYLDTNTPAVFYHDEVSLYGYSASRQLGKLNLNNPKLVDTIPGFINERTELYDAEEILHTLNYARLGAKSAKEKIKYDEFIDDVKSMIISILPEAEKIKKIDILPPKVLSSDPEGGIIITMRNGEKIPFSEFSLGYKTVTSWVIDLSWRLFTKFQGKTPKPLHEPAIVLIDELDLHLHPKWQREIMQNLCNHFPNTQFIATAHSPLMVQAAMESNYSVLKFENGVVEILNQPEGLDGWRVDQILTSELFGLESSRGLKYDNLIQRRRVLMGKTRLSAEDKSELEEIDEELSGLPAGDNPKDMRSREIVNELYEKMMKGGIKFDA
jgi:energy-coupling factor transporter ATP-binding protein EcfA2